MSCVFKIFVLLCFIQYIKATDDKLVEKTKGLTVVTVATDATDGFKRFARSIKKYDLDLEVLGMGKEWKGGDIQRFPGGGQKVIFFKSFLEKVKDYKDLVVLFTDSYDVVLTAGENEILKAFKKLDARVVFSAEGFCWPDAKLESKYPEVKSNEKRFLNSGGFIGYAPELYKIVTSSEISNEDDDQLFYTNIFLNEELREKLKIKLDTKAEIFQPLNGALEEVQIKFKGATSYMYNSKTGNQPAVIHGNGPIKEEFNNLGNYLGNAWTMTMGCLQCKEDTISLEGVQDADMPRVFLAIFLQWPIPFAEEFFDGIGKLDYPKDRIDLFIHYVDFHEKDVTRFMEAHGMKYNSAKLYGKEDKLNQWTGRNQALEDCLKEDCDYMFAVDGEFQIEDFNVLRHLIQTNRSVISPFLNRPEKLWSNFWGALTKDGYYKRSPDYSDIVTGIRRGIWNVPYITTCILFHAHRVRELLGGYVYGDLDQDMAIGATMRHKGIFMYVDNQRYFGHLVNSEDFETNHLNNDMYTIFSNQHDWEKKYIHPDYRNSLLNETVIEQPCTDVYWSPIFSRRLCNDLIDEMENFGEWSGGKNEDARLQGGYENVPTVDIHMTQIGFERHWLQFLKEYVGPVNAKLYLGYFTDSRAVMNFVVRYKPGEQDSLRPHHDHSTYTINVALNRVNVDYTGGGVNFVRYNCALTGLRQGWMLMHPGRLTHLHEGLRTTGGTRYIAVSFIDPPE